MMLSSSLSFRSKENGEKERERKRKEEKGRHEIGSNWGKTGYIFLVLFEERPKAEFFCKLPSLGIDFFLE